METKRETNRETKKETKQETRRVTKINCRIKLKALGNICFGSAWATDRFDIKTLWAEMGDKKGNETGDERDMKTRRKGRRNGMHKMRPKGTQTNMIDWY